MLDLDTGRAAVPPREAATLLLVRDGVEDDAPCVELFCVVRHAKSGFMGGAVVFPGGKVDPTDRDPAWAMCATGAPRFGEADDEVTARAFAVAACREALEEAALLLHDGAPLDHDATLALRAEVAGGRSLREALLGRGVTLDVGALRPFARWVTPVAESRRFDTRFFIAVAPKGQHGAHDAHETTASFWASPREVLRRFDAGEIQLAPPTHRSLELLSTTSSAASALALAAGLGLDPICPRLVTLDGEAAGGATMALVLPGDPEHDVPSRRVPGATRFVLRGERWRPE